MKFHDFLRAERFLVFQPPMLLSGCCYKRTEHKQATKAKTVDAVEQAGVVKGELGSVEGFCVKVQSSVKREERRKASEDEREREA